jgi:hypothetical protein
MPLTVAVPLKSTVWDVITSVGTMAAVLVALGLGVAPRFYQWHRRARLDLRVSNDRPHVRLTGVMNEPKVAYLRLEVRNAGKAEARRCRLTATDWYVLEPVDGQPDWARYDTDPCAMHWVSTPPLVRKTWTRQGEQRGALPGVMLTGATEQVHVRSTPPEVNIQSGLWDLADLCWVRQGSPVHLVADDETPRGFRMDAHKSDGSYALTIALTSENANGKQRTVGFRVENGVYRDVNFVDPPRAWRSGDPLSDETSLEGSSDL